ncbi:response regulator [Moorena bouillonii]|uniref:Response regulator n=1 Tax=Moorena bouillonii PNG TaxID=568701 RepID=A0A1U7N583_9CYAN|nr:response regulator [Moorena bouillonii]OLT61102.1 response regulator [Moorena bouillonii PNG]
MILIRLIEELEKLGKQRTIGELTLSNHSVVWKVYLVYGQLLYATDGVHPVRRFYRALKSHCPNYVVELDEKSDYQPWEYQLLEQGINQKKLSLIQAKLMIRSIVQECFFELSGYTDLKNNWQPSQEKTSTLAMGLALSSREIQTVYAQANQNYQEWVAADFGHLSPNLSPVLKPGTDPKLLPDLNKYLNGNLTLWDIAWEQKTSVTEVTRFLLPLVEKSMVDFRRIPDLASLPVTAPVKPPVTAPVNPPVTAPVNPTVTAPVKPPVLTTSPPSETQGSKSAKKQPLIACIDDSPVLAHSLKTILIPAGYQMLSIEEPMRGFSQLIEHKPDLILLDLNMPNANGYSVCKFLRESPVFNKTPIIILTAQNTTIDRARARLVGATDFLGKPPDSQELLRIINKYVIKSL